MGELKKLLTIASIGVVCGFIIGFFDYVLQVVTNHYIQYRLFRLMAADFQEIGTIVIYFTCGLLLFHYFTALLFRLLKWNRDKIIMVDSLFVVAVMGLYILERLLDRFTYYTLSLGLERFFRKIADLFSFQRGFGDTIGLLKKNLIAVIFFIAAITVFIILLRLSRKLNWGRFSGIIKNRTRIILRTGAIIIIFLLIVKAGIFIHLRLDPPPGPNILFIVVDCLRADHLGYHGYHRDTSPTIDRLSREGIDFKNNYSNSSWTKPAVVTMLTSLYPNRHNVLGLTDIFPSSFLSISEILKNKGYRTSFLIGGNTALREQFNFPQGFDYYINEGKKLSRAPVLTDKFLSLIPKSPKERFFAYIHYMDVHMPYAKNDFNNLFTGEKENKYFIAGEVSQHQVRDWTAQNKLSQQDKQFCIGLYDGQIRLVDRQIERIIQALKEKGIYDNTLVVITADHGEEFWDHGNFEHAHSLYNEIIHIPLVIVGNRVPSAEVKKYVSLIDLMPTVLKLTQIPTGRFNLQGVDFSHLLSDGGKVGEDGPGVDVFAMGTLYGDEKLCLVDQNNYKLIFNTGNEEEKDPLPGYRSKEKYELYHLSGDSMERENLVKVDNRRFLALEKELERFAGIKALRKSKRRELDEETKKQLKSLGYL